MKGMRFMSSGDIICINEKRQRGEIKVLIQFCEENGLQFRKDNSPFSIPAYTKII